jgi:hypothetical protein
MLRRLASLALLAALIPAQSIRTVNVPCCQFVDSVSLTNVTTVPAGTIVRWVLQGLPVTHTVTNGTSPTAPGAGSLFNGTLSSSATTFQFTFNTPGTFPYFCSPHFSSGMTGTVNVFVPASATANGQGCTGTSGSPLVLSAQGLPVIGSTNFGMSVVGGPPNGLSLWYASIGAQVPPIALGGGCNLYLDFASLQLLISLGVVPIAIPLSPAGAAALPFPVAPSITPGTRLDVQVACPDATATGFVTSNGLVLIFGS